MTSLGTATSLSPLSSICKTNWCSASEIETMVSGLNPDTCIVPSFANGVVHSPIVGNSHSLFMVAL